MSARPITTVTIVVIKHNVVEEIIAFPDNPAGNEAAEKVFVDKCAHYISNWDEYTQEDIDTALESGYEKFGTGSVCISHT